MNIITIIIVIELFLIIVVGRECIRLVKEIDRIKAETARIEEKTRKSKEMRESRGR